VKAWWFADCPLDLFFFPLFQTSAAVAINGGDFFSRVDALPGRTANCVKALKELGALTLPGKQGSAVADKPARDALQQGERKN